MSNTLSGAGAGYLKILDFNTAIAACNAVIDSGKNESSTKKTSDQPDKGNGNSQNNRQPMAGADDYVCRAYARCFVPKKDNAHFDDAIADCSMAIYLALKQTKDKDGKGEEPVTSQNKALSYTARRIRAFASYLKGDYANALADCAEVIQGTDAEDSAFARELQTKIHVNRGDYQDVAQLFRAAIEITSKGNIFHSLALAESYLAACKRMNNE